MSPTLIPTMSKDMEDQLKLAHQVIELMNCTNRKTAVTLLRYSVDRPEGSYAEFR